MNKDKAIELAGGAKELAKLLGVTHQAVYAWRENKLPALQAYRLMDLRPHWFSKEKARF